MTTRTRRKCLSIDSPFNPHVRHHPDHHRPYRWDQIIDQLTARNNSYSATYTTVKMMKHGILLPRRWWYRMEKFSAQKIMRIQTMRWLKPIRAWQKNIPPHFPLPALSLPRSGETGNAATSIIHKTHKLIPENHSSSPVEIIISVAWKLPPIPWFRNYTFAFFSSPADVV